MDICNSDERRKKVALLNFYFDRVEEQGSGTLISLEIAQASNFFGLSSLNYLITLDTGTKEGFSLSMKSD